MYKLIFGKFCIVINVLIFVIAPSTAFAETKTLKGTFEGRPEAKLVIKLERLGGNPFQIKRFTFKDLPFTCFGDTPNGKVTATVGKMSINKGQNPFNPSQQTFVYFSKSGQLTKKDEIGVFITAITNKKGTKTSGNFGMSFGDGCSHSKTAPFIKFVANG